MSPSRRDGESSCPARKGGASWLSLALPIATLLSGACSRGDSREASLSETSVADTVHVGPDQETFFTDLPGVNGLEALSAGQQAAVTARANRAKCDCGCFGHSVSACLHQQEACELATRLAMQFVADASLGETLARGEAGAALSDASAPTGAVNAAPPAGAGEETPPAGAGEETPPAGTGDETTSAGAGTETTSAGAVDEMPPADAGDETPPAAGEPATTPAGGAGSLVPAPSGSAPAPESPRTP